MTRPLDWLARHVKVVAVAVGLLGGALLLRQALALVDAESARRFDAEQFQQQREMIDGLAKVREDDLLKKMHPRRPMAGPRAAVTSK